MVSFTILHSLEGRRDSKTRQRTYQENLINTFLTNILRQDAIERDIISI